MTDNAWDTAPEPARVLAAAMEPGAHVMAVRLDPDGSRVVSAYTVGEGRERVGEMTRVIPPPFGRRVANRFRCFLGGHLWEVDAEGTILVCALTGHTRPVETDVRA